MILRPVSYKRHRFPREIIAHAVWLYFRFPLSLRLVEEVLLERGIVASYESIRRWAIKFGADYACRLKRKAPSRDDIRYLDEVVISINGEGAVTLPREGHERSMPYGFLSRRDGLAPRGHRRGAEHAVCLSGREMALDVENVVDGGGG